MNLDVGVQQQHVASPRGVKSDVIGGREATVVAPEDPHLVELRLDRLRRTVGRPRVDDQPLEPMPARPPPSPIASVRSAISARCG